MNCFRSLILLALLSLVAPIAAQTTRNDLSLIRVDKSANFAYWNRDAQSLQHLKDFVAHVTDPNGKDFVPVSERIAVFDVDGTMICETAPYYFNWLLFFNRFLHDPSFHPDPADRAWAQEVEEYVTVHHKARSSDWGPKQQLLQAKGFQGLTQSEMFDYVNGFVDTASVRGLSPLTWGTALYWPMIEVVSYLLANDFQVYLCSGVDRDICRPLVCDICHIPYNHVISSDVDYVLEGQAAQGQWSEIADAESYVYTPNERVLRGSLRQLVTASNKVTYLTRELGVKPILAWGNSSGDFPMFHHVMLDNPRPHIVFCILCDDVERELGNLQKADKCKNACLDNGWIPVSMRLDWSTIYGPSVHPISK